MTNSANETQVGGAHYRAKDPAYQHWDFVVDARLGYLEGCATKYIARHHLKNGRQDLEKAQHYVQKLIECADSSRVREPAIFDARVHAAIKRFVHSLDHDPEASWVQAIATWRSMAELRNIEAGLKKLTELRYPTEAGAAYVKQD